MDTYFSPTNKKQSEKPKISIIIPVYKVEKYLKKCIESILAQSFSAFELLLIDDGSPDNSGIICDNYAKMDNRIIVIHKENGGVSNARNTGIEWVLNNSTSEWITFVDSDDWLNTNYLSYLYRGVSRHNCDIGMVRLTNVSSEENVYEKEYSSGVVSAKEAYFFNNSDTIYGFVIGKLFRASLFVDFSFPQGKVYEDLATVHQLLFCCNKIAMISCNLYLYRFNPDSITNSDWSISHMEGKVYALSEIEKYFRNYGDRELYRTVLLNYGRCLDAQYQALKPYLSIDEKDKNVFLKGLIKKMKFVLKRAKKNKIQVVTDFPALCNNVYPTTMWLYWLIIGIYNKLRKTK